MEARSIFFWVVAVLIGVGSLNSYAKTGITSPEKIVACSDLKLGQMCKTSKNQCFKMVNDDAFGLGIQEMGDDCKHKGTIWARQLQQEDVTYETAQKACPQGTRPPTQEEFTRLRSSVGTEEYKSDSDWSKKYNKELLSKDGRKELHALLPDMPDMKGHWWFWSSSPVSNSFAFGFYGISGNVFHGLRDRNNGSVRCVR